MKIAKCSNGTSYECKQKWPQDCFVQCGAAGLVLRKDGSYKTAFFESFPKISDTLPKKKKTKKIRKTNKKNKLKKIKEYSETFFLRGEGQNIEEAELSAFKKFLKIKQCAIHGHTFTRKGVSDGKCKHCSFIKSYVFEPNTICSECNKKAVFSTIGDNYYCFKHYISTIEKVNDEELLKLSQSSAEKSMLEKVLFMGMDDEEERQEKISYYRDNHVILKSLVKNNVIKLSQKEINTYPVFDKISNDFIHFYVSFIYKLIKSNSIINADSITFGEYINVKDKIMKEISNYSELYTLIFERFLFEKGIVNQDIKESALSEALDVLKNNIDLK